MDSAAKGMSTETKAGLVLAMAALLGLLFENIAYLTPTYDMLLGAKLTVAIEGAAIDKPLLLWINDGLMAIFFLFVALEIKKEIVEGALSDWQGDDGVFARTGVVGVWWITRRAPFSTARRTA
ncbi:MAG: Na+/H+ antiporter NhaA, partial [Pseudomonadota bacterium]